MKSTSFIIILMLVSAGLTAGFASAEKKSVTLDDVGVEVEHSDDNKDSHVQKRSGSADYVVHFKSGLLSSLGHASASLASSSSHGSGGVGGGGYNYNTHSDGHHSNSVDYDPWTLKKSVWNTIFQAVKAITGGVTALKGQLIKGSGYALRASGHVVAASGDKVTDVGKYIINKAQSNLHPIPSGSGGLPFNKFSSFSSGGQKYAASPVVHTETISTYEYPTSGHSKYGPPSNLPSYSSVSHQYVPSSDSIGSSGGGGGYGHSNTAAFEAPYKSYLPASFGIDGHDDFKVYRGSNQLTEEDSRKATQQLKEVVSLLPDSTNKCKNTNNLVYDALTYDPQLQLEDVSQYDLAEHVDRELPLSAIGTISASYPETVNKYVYESSADVYHKMQKQNLSPEEIYLSKHPDEADEFKSHLNNNADSYKHYNNHIFGDNESSKLPTPQTANYRPSTDNTDNKIHLISKDLQQYEEQASNSHSERFPPRATTKINYYIYQPVHSKYRPPRHLPKSKIFQQTFKQPQRRYVNVEPEYKTYDYDHLNSIVYGGMLGNV